VDNKNVTQMKTTGKTFYFISNYTVLDRVNF